MTPIIDLSLGWRIGAPTTLFGGDSRFAAASEAQNANDGRRHGKHEEEAPEEFHRPDLFVGLTRIELVTSSLSGMRSNQLSYSPLSGLSS